MARPHTAAHGDDVERLATLIGMDLPDNLAALLNDPQLLSDLAFVRSLRQLRFITANGEIPLQFEEGVENAIVDLRDLTASGAPNANAIPDQTGNASKFLQTDGAVMAWAQAGATLYTELQRDAPQSTATSTTTPISFDTVIENNSGVFSAGSPTRLTIPVSGIWQGAFWVYWEANAVGIRENFVRKNGTTFYFTDDRAALPSNGTSVLINWTLRLAAGDYLEYCGWQNSGGALTIRCQSASICRIGD